MRNLDTGYFSGRLQWIIGAGVLALLSIFILPKLVEEIYPDDLTVIQAPITGVLSWQTKPGWAWQGLGDVTTYKRRNTVEFNTKATGLSIRFSDGGHATMYGSVQFAMPDDVKSLNAIHSAYRGNDVVVANLLKTVLNKSVYLTGTLMTSKESYSEKKNDLIHYVTDQMQNGIYRTRQITKWVKDEITGQSKEVTLAEIVLDGQGNILRQEESVLNQFNIKAYNFTIDTMPYDDVIEAQIKQQQSITMAVQTSIAEAKQKDQQALTAEAEGRATIARAKAEQETIKTREVTKAEQQRQVDIIGAEREKQVAITAANKEREVAETAARKRLAVAELDTKAAEQIKQEQILLGQGESERRKLVLAADGALAQKLKTYEAVSALWADALSKYRGSITPQYLTGATTAGSQSPNAFQSFVELQTMKAMKDLNLDLSLQTTATGK